MSKIAGRIAVHVPGHPAANNRGYVLRARYVMEKNLGRRLRSDEEVHHKNGNPMDDRYRNLEVWTTAEHCRLHRPSQFIKRKLDWDMVECLMADGLGCRNIARICNYSLSSVKRIMKSLRG